MVFLTQRYSFFWWIVTRMILLKFHHNLRLLLIICVLSEVLRTKAPRRLKKSPSGHLTKETEFSAVPLFLPHSSAAASHDLTIAVSVTGNPGKNYCIHSFSSKGVSIRIPDSLASSGCFLNLENESFSLSALFKCMTILKSDKNLVN